MLCFVNNFWKVIEAFGDVHQDSWVLVVGSEMNIIRTTSWVRYCNTRHRVVFRNTPQLPTYMSDTYNFLFFSFSFSFMFLASVSFHMTFWSCRRLWDHTVSTMVWTVTASTDHHKQFTFGSSLASFIWWPVWLKLPWRVHAVQYDSSQIVSNSGVFHKIFQRHCGRLDMLTIRSCLWLSSEF